MQSGEHQRQGPLLISGQIHLCDFSQSVQLLSRIRLFATPCITAHQASLSITNSRSLLILMCIESVMPSSHLIPYHPLILLPPIPASIRVFSNESTLCMRWPEYLLSAGELMLLNCGVGEDSWESLGLQGDPTRTSVNWALKGSNQKGFTNWRYALWCQQQRFWEIV